MSRFIFKLHRHIRDMRLHGKGAHPHMSPPPEKTYPRMPQIALPRLERPLSSLDEVLRTRRSFDEALSTDGLALPVLGALFDVALAQHNERCPYPSGGALYPLEVYVVGRVITGERSAVYHYRPKEHVLEHLWDYALEPREILSTESTPHGACYVVFCARWYVASRKYGDFAYLNSLMEAGHAAQNVLLAATALNVQARPIAGFADALITRMLDLDERHEQPVYLVALAS